MDDASILKALKALAEEDRTREAPAAVGVRLRAEFRARPRRRFLRQVVPWTLAAAAGLIAGIIFLRDPGRPAPSSTASKLPAAAGQPERVSRPAPAASAARTPAPARIARRTASAMPALRDAVPDAAGPQVVTGFYPLLDPAPPFERGQILRVNLPASAMRSVGLPVHEDRLNEAVQADVLLGEEGLPRAIRFVGFQVR